ncbi:Predicted DNA binding protein, contains HTH domain [Haloplanus vescus]|uniref:Predicted DNA binding protein, contains HTH domain n=1 Tax=Haloplanus vescus TaxID=555874 RepID=A0A1H3Z8N8_9EURY|nr:helix-turn-helix domain-containing protein [Haloplanus vescus]SEA19692.1 Predicted DNA binding protein, contains HTH domain [Haloplanus vescus]
MGVIVDVRIPAHDFEFGRRFPIRDGDAELERVEPRGDDDVAIFSLSNPPTNRTDGGENPFTGTDGYQLDRIHLGDERTLHVLEWDADADPLVRLLEEHDGSIRRGTGSTDAWTFETQFPTHEAFDSFRSAVDGAKANVEVLRVYNPTRQGTGAWYGLTPRQRRTLELAVERGYYDIPRRCTTIELADELGISDQAVTERLRRGIVTFVTNALLLDDE